MISVDQALDLILGRTAPLPAEAVATEEAVGRIVAQDVHARDHLPPFDNSAMDGFAVKTQDLGGASLKKPVILKLSETVRAGSLSRVELERGQAVKIMTGAPIPSGADAVVMREHTEENAGCVRVMRKVARGENVRPAGEDVAKGSLILKAGSLIRPYEVALLAAQGITSLSVVRRPRVAIVATGDELVAFDRPTLGPAQIRNSNTPAIAAALKRWGAMTVELGIAPDHPQKLEKAFRNGIDRADLMIVSGGVSVGDFDYTKSILEKMGMETVFWRVAMKPGKPLLFGILDGRIVFGVPGNPVSTLVCLEEFLRPAIERMHGHKIKHPSWHLEGMVDEDQRIRDHERRHFLFSQAYQENGRFHLHVIRPQGSAMIAMAVQANALAVVREGTAVVKKGEKLAFKWLK
ncbi:MAG: molybdopterin molybdotransferase MoeA [Elusimicrobia bacterium]|nr:molybdopterin molybdotransferase MoeA [Elusimicrobiota bacterium]